MITDIASSIKKINVFKENYRDDFVDRLSYRFATLALLMAIILIILMQYIMNPISCYLASDPGGENTVDYVENYCFVEGTIPISQYNSIPTNDKDWQMLYEKKKTRYYQWVPLMLGLQALMFYLPHLIWKLLNNNNRCNGLKSIITQANEAKATEGATRKSHVLRLTKALDSLLFEDQPVYSRDCRGCLSRFAEIILLSKRSGMQMFNFYIFIKLLYVGNAVGQLVLMNQFLSWDRREKSMLGYNVIRDILLGKDWEKTQVFPRVAYCIVPLRTIAGTIYTLAQCALPFNMLNEKIYVFLWIFFSILLIVTFLSLLKLIFLRLHPSRRSQIISRYLRLNEAFKEKKESKRKLKRFHEKFLKNDGIFLLNILAKESGDVITGEIIRQMWEKFKNGMHQVDEKTIKELCKVDQSKEKKTKSESQERKSVSIQIPEHAFFSTQDRETDDYTIIKPLS